MKSQTTAPAARAMKKARLSGVALTAMPSAPSMACIVGSQIAGAKLADSGVLWPGAMSTSTSSQVSSVAAMKLNMIVVITTWLPRRACSQAGISAQAAPHPIAAMSASGSTSQRSEEHTSELQSHHDLVCRLLLEKKKKKPYSPNSTNIPTKTTTKP